MNEHKDENTGKKITEEKVKTVRPYGIIYGERNHYLVSKDIDPVTSKAVSTISRLSKEDRILEVARMLSGSVLTDAAIENAKSLLA